MSSSNSGSPAATGAFTRVLFLAVIIIVGAWAVVGCIGWWLACPDWFSRLLMIGFHVGAASFAACAFKVATGAPSFWRGAPLAGLGVLCLIATGFGGEQGLRLIEAKTWAVYDAYRASLPARAEAEARLAAIMRDLHALPPVPLTYPDGRPIGVNTRDRLIAEHAREQDRLSLAERTARLEVEATARVPVAAPGLRMPTHVRLGIVILAEVVEVLGFWSVGWAVGAPQRARLPRRLGLAARLMALAGLGAQPSPSATAHDAAAAVPTPNGQIEVVEGATPLDVATHVLGAPCAPNRPAQAMAPFDVRGETVIARCADLRALRVHKQAQARTWVLEGVPKTEIARRLGVHRNTVHNWTRL